MSDTVLLRGAKQLLTLRGSDRPRRGLALRDLGIIPDASVLIRDGLVDCVGSSRRVDNLKAARGAEEINVTGCVVMPGFVDCHTHLICGAPRLDDYEKRIAGATYEQIAEEGGGILSTVRTVRSITARGLQVRARRMINAFIRHGSTTIEAKTGYGLDRTGEMKTLRILSALNGKPLEIVPTYLGAHVVPPEFEGRPEDYIDWMAAGIMPRIRRRRLAQFADVYCERGAFNFYDASRYLEIARRMGFQLKVHAEQFRHSGITRVAVGLGAASVDHLEHAGMDDISALAQSSTIAVLLPGSVFHLGLSRYAPARTLIEYGVAVALATDFNPGTSPTCNMQMVLSLACVQMRMTPAEAISAATINGAHALCCADRVGSIEPGKQADLIVLEASDYREIPYRFGVNLVSMTMKKGKVLYRQGGVSCPED